MKSRQLKKYTRVHGNCHSVGIAKFRNISIYDQELECIPKKLVISPINIEVDISELMPFLKGNEDIRLEYSCDISEYYAANNRYFNGGIRDVAVPFAIYIVDYDGADFLWRGTVIDATAVLNRKCKHLFSDKLKINVLSPEKEIQKISLSLWGRSVAELLQYKKEYFLTDIPFYSIYNLLLIAIIIGSTLWHKPIVLFAFTAFTTGFIYYLCFLFIRIFQKSQVRLKDKITYLYYSRLKTFSARVPFTKVLKTNTADIVKAINNKLKFAVGLLILTLFSAAFTIVLKYAGVILW